MFAESLDLYKNIVSGTTPMENHKQDTRSFLMRCATFVIDEAYQLYMHDKKGFNDFLQIVLREAAYVRKNCVIIFLAGEMDCESIFRRRMFELFGTAYCATVSGMSTRLDSFSIIMPGGTLGDLRDFILFQLTDDEQLRASLGNITDEDVHMLLSICGDNLQSLDNLIERKAFSLNGSLCEFH